jgi:hypothetical protein
VEEIPNDADETNLLASSVLRGVQILFAIVVIGLSVTLIKGHNDHNGFTGLFKPPTILPLAAAIGALSPVTAVFSLSVSWTDLLRECIEMLVDVVVIMANITGGTVCIVGMWKLGSVLTRTDYSPSNSEARIAAI